MDAGSATNYQRGVLPSSNKPAAGVSDSRVNSVVATLKLNDATVSRLQVAKKFDKNEAVVNSVSFSDSGERLMTSGEDDQIRLYDAVQGTYMKDIGSKKYGCDHATFTHSNDQGLHSSNKLDHGIRHLDLTNSKYIRYFQAHTGKVDLLKMCPQQELFMSGSAADRSFRIWDVRSQHCQGLINMFGYKPLDPTARHSFVAAFDPTGLAFGIGSEDRIVRLYDLRSFDKGPFSTFGFEGEFDESEWQDLKFSPDGRKIIVATSSKILVIDAFTGQTLWIFREHRGTEIPSPIPLEPCFSPCSRYLFCGSTNAKLLTWNVDTGALTAISETGDNICSVLKFSSTFFMLASACMSTCFWVPRVLGDENDDIGSSPGSAYSNHQNNVEEIHDVDENARFSTRLTDNLSRVSIGH